MAERRAVMDASAIVAWLLKERGAATVGRLLQFSVLPAPNVTESIRTARSLGHRMTSDQLFSRLEAACAAIEPFRAVDAARAAELLLLEVDFHQFR